jgi:hypothetical protein
MDMLGIGNYVCPAWGKPYLNSINRDIRQHRKSIIQFNLTVHGNRKMATLYSLNLITFNNTVDKICHVSKNPVQLQI